MNAAAVSESAIRTRPLDPRAQGEALPLLVEPVTADARDVATLTRWLEGARVAVAERLARHGALLFRGFAVDGPADFERVARAIDPELKNDYLGTSPRDALTEYVFSASELPPYYPIPQHIEMSFVPAPPRRLFFFCMIAPTGNGGETPLCDFRKVYRDLDPAVRARFDEKGVRNVRNYAGPDGGSRLDLWKLKRWDQMFHTTDHEVVARACRDNGFEHTFSDAGGGGERLRLINRQPATRKHPVTGETVWFNHTQVFHLSAVPAEYRRIAARQGQLRYRLLAGVARAMVLAKRRLTATDDQAMHCTYGDGSPISDGDMDAVRDAIWGNMVFVPWQRGDVVAIDNFAVSHGRMPYSGPRKVAVCWA